MPDESWPGKNNRITCELVSLPTEYALYMYVSSTTYYIYPTIGFAQE